MSPPDKRYNEKTFRALLWFNTLTAVGMATCVVTGQVKVSIQLFGYPIVFPASNLFFAFLTFPITDMIADVFGKREANFTVWVGFVSQLATIIILEICMLLPGETAKLAPFHLGGWVVFFGSTVAYLVSQFWDVYFFHWIKENVTGEKHLWIRNNLSTMSSQIMNSAIFIFIVFGVDELLIMLSGSIVIKCITAILDTPFVYLGRYVLLKKEERAFA